MGIGGDEKDKDKDSEDAYDNNDVDKMIKRLCGICIWIGDMTRTTITKGGGDGKGEMNGSGSYDQKAGQTTKLTALELMNFYNKIGYSL